LQTEWAYRQVFTSNAERGNALAPWIEYYNTRRRGVWNVATVIEDAALGLGAPALLRHQDG
jgi:hypothetical protein